MKLESWSNYYPESEGYEAGLLFPSNPSSTSIIPIQSNSYIYNCVFETANKKAIFFSQSSSLSASILLIEHCSFNSIHSTDAGGAIYFGNQGECVLASVCGYQCTTSTTNNGQFCYIQVSNLDTCKNHFFDSTVTASIATADRIMELDYGNLKCKGVNLSNNNVNQISCFYIRPTTLSLISFSSFRNNSANNFRCILFNYQKHIVNCTNIIENIQNSPSSGIITVWNQALLEMTHCSIYGNDPKQASVFANEDGRSSITCIFCSIGSNQTGDFQSNELSTESFINYYDYLELGNCKASIEEWGNITANPPFFMKSYFHYQKFFNKQNDENGGINSNISILVYLSLIYFSI